MTDRYTKESLDALKEIVEKAKDVDKNNQEEINKAVDEINEGIDGLRRLPVEPSDPVAWWDFDGDEPIKDKTGRGNDGVEQGTVSYVPGLENLGNGLSTKDGYVSVAKVTDDLNLGTQDYSVGFGIKHQIQEHGQQFLEIKTGIVELILGLQLFKDKGNSIQLMLQMDIVNKKISLVVLPAKFMIINGIILQLF